MRPPRLPRSPLFAIPPLATFVATLTGVGTIAIGLAVVATPARAFFPLTARECYAVSYAEPVTGLAALYLPHHIVLRPDGSADLLTGLGGIVDISVAGHRYASWSGSSSTLLIAFTEASARLSVHLVAQWDVGELHGVAMLFMNGGPGPTLRRRFDADRIPCPPVARPLPNELVPGQYHFMLVAGRGSEVGARSAGILTLYPTSAADRSPVRPNERARADTLEYPMYGATDLNFARVGAPLDYQGLSAPPPASLDPLHPGVLVHCEYDSSRTSPPGITLLIGTVDNERVARTGVYFVRVDGAGIELTVRRIVGGRVFGVWRAHGMVVNGSGEFYLVPADGER